MYEATIRSKMKGGSGRTTEKSMRVRVAPIWGQDQNPRIPRTGRFDYPERLSNVRLLQGSHPDAAEFVGAASTSVTRDNMSLFKPKSATSAAGPGLESTPAQPSAAAAPAGPDVKQLMAELSELRKRKELSSLTADEIEILASTTAAAMIAAAHKRQAEASAAVEQAVAEAKRRATQVLAEAEAKLAAAETALQSAAGEAQRQAQAVLSSAQQQAKHIVEAAQAETIAMRTELQTRLADVAGERERLLAAAKREADDLRAKAQAAAAEHAEWLRKQIDSATRIQQGVSERLESVAAALSAHRETVTTSLTALLGLTAQPATAESSPNIAPTQTTDTPVEGQGSTATAEFRAATIEEPHQD